MTIALQGINLGDNTRVDNNDLLTQALSANELQATFDFQQQVRYLLKRPLTTITIFQGVIIPSLTWYNSNL